MWGRLTPSGRKPPLLITSDGPPKPCWIPRSFRILCLFVVNWIKGLKGESKLMYLVFLCSFDYHCFRYLINMYAQDAMNVIKIHLLYLFIYFRNIFVFEKIYLCFIYILFKKKWFKHEEKGILVIWQVVCCLIMLDFDLEIWRIWFGFI